MVKTNTRTEVVVIDGALEHKKEILNFLLGLEWSEQYSMVNFIPWQTSAEFTKINQIEAICIHKEYMSTLTSEILKIQNPNAVLETGGDDEFTFVNWLESKTFNDSNIFYRVEKIGAVEVLLAYPKANEAYVNDLVPQIPQILEEDYDLNMVGAVFGSTHNVKIRRIKQKSARTHLANLKKNNGNSQANEDDTPQKINLFHDRPPVTMEQVEKSYANAVAPSNNPKQQPVTADINQLSESLKTLQRDYDQLKESLPTSYVDEILTQVDTKMSEMETRIDGKIKASEERTTGKLDEFFTIFQRENKTERAAQKKADNAFRESLLRAVSVQSPLRDQIQDETPRGVSPSAREEEKRVHEEQPNRETFCL